MEITTKIYRNKNFDEPNRKNRIGIGGCAEVFKLHEKKTGQEYAIKILLEEDQNQDFIDSFLEEINIISKLKYPTLLCLQGITIEDPLYIIMEYMPNKTVQYYIDKAYSGQTYEKWNLANKIIIILGISFGMEYLHSENIVHRDLKPGNVLLDSNFYPRIGDFGFSKIISSSKRLSSNLGTPLFTAPEQMGSPNYDGKKADVYSFGMTLYSILYNQLPFAGDVGEGLKKIARGERPELEEVASKSLNKLISICWDNDPKNRPTFEDISKELIKEVKILNERKEIKEEEMRNIEQFEKEFCKRKNIENIENNEELMKKFEENWKNDEDYKDDPEHFSLLHYAAKTNSKEMLEILISKGADINTKTIIYLNKGILF